jgi:UDP-N-acetylglucosamine:LPS N-acetylglucosamine transferase
MLASVDMGYGHLRAAAALADHLGQRVIRVDEPPHAAPWEAREWRRTKAAYELLSRLSQTAVIGRPFRGFLHKLTSVDPVVPGRWPGSGVRRLDRLIERGFGKLMAAELDIARRALVTTFYAPALAADRHASVPVTCVVTDTVIHRIWAPLDPEHTRIRYLVPAPATRDRLLAFGVPDANIAVTGFPLPPSLDSRAAELLANRLARLKPDEPASPLLTLAIGGAGAQADRARRLVRSLKHDLLAGRWRLALVAGTRIRLGARFREMSLRELGDRAELVEIVAEPEFEAAYRRFNELLERTDVLWTKPSELVFYAALGLPLVLDDAVGDHENANAQWILQAGAGVRRPAFGRIATQLARWRHDGVLAECARNAFVGLPRGATKRIVNAVFNVS